MKRLTVYYLLLCIAVNAHGQYYLRGTVRDDKNLALFNARIFLQSNKQSYYTSSDGSFGIPVKQAIDSVTVSLDGYESLTVRVRADLWQTFTLKMSADAIFRNRPRLISSIRDKKREQRYNPVIGDETYFKLVENEFVKANKFPNTAFSLNVNKAAYSNVRRFINMGSRLPPDAVRIEELINYFNLGYNQPPGNDIFRIESTVTGCPWNVKNKLLYLNISAKKLNLENKPPANFVFLIDVSASMDMPNRLALLKQAFQLFVKNLRPQDKVTIVTYGGTVGVWLPSTPGSEQEKISRSIEVLTAAGDTPGASALDMAYREATRSFIKDGNNRVILATDGDFNVGPASEKELDELITRQRQTGVYLTCLGVGMGNFKDSKLQTLAKRGNGNYAYLDDLHEAEKVMVHELTETLYAVADNAFINVEFDPAKVNAYRLIGFDNKREAVQDGSSVQDGGEIGSGSSTTALFEIEPGADSVMSNSGDLGMLYLKFHDAADSLPREQQMGYCIPAMPVDSVKPSLRFAAALAMYGMKLKESPYLNKASWDNIAAVAASSADKSDYLQNDFLLLLDKTINIYEPKKNKKKKKKFIF